jgi:hypothetical protein
MASEFQLVFGRLRAILQKHSGRLSVEEDSSKCYSLAGSPGPATLKAWGGKTRALMLPVAWVQIGKGYVSYHLMGIDGNAKLRDGMSKELKARMQGRSCFNFRAAEETLFAELDGLTAQSIARFRNAGFIVG